MMNSEDKILIDEEAVIDAIWKSTTYRKTMVASYHTTEEPTFLQKITARFIGVQYRYNSEGRDWLVRYFVYGLCNNGDFCPMRNKNLYIRIFLRDPARLNRKVRWHIGSSQEAPKGMMINIK